MGHRAVRGVVGGLLVGREGAVGVGRGRDADQRLQRQGAAQRATGGEEWVLECAVSVVERWMGHRAVRGVVGGLLVGREGAMGVGRGRDADQRLQRQGVAQRATGGEEWVLECAVSVVERWMGHRAVRGVVGGLLVGREGAVGVGMGRDADQRLQRQGVAQRATGGEEWVLECAVSVVERWMGHRAVRGVVGGLLVGREGAVGVGMGRDADQRLQRQGVAQRATGGEDWVLEGARCSQTRVRPPRDPAWVRHGRRLASSLPCPALGFSVFPCRVQRAAPMVNGKTYMTHQPSSAARNSAARIREALRLRIYLASVLYDPKQVVIVFNSSLTNTCLITLKNLANTRI